MKIVWWLLFVLLIVYQVNSQNANCNTTDVLRGCISCDISFHTALNISSNKLVCTDIVNCTIIDQNACVSCNNNSIIDNVTDLCVISLGCQIISNGTCIKCIQTNYVLDEANNKCNRIILNYCWETNLTGCQVCVDQNILTQSNCSIDISLCQNFNYIEWKCQSCPSGMLMDSSAIYCYSLISNCLFYQSGTCLICELGYSFNGSVCQDGSSINLYLEFIATSAKLNIGSTLIAKCLNNNQYYNTTTINCQTTTSKFPYCQISNTTACQTCIIGFYLNSTNQCQPCVQQNCLKCDSNSCKQCLPNYYLVIEGISSNIITFFTNSKDTDTSLCLPCSSLACLKCSNQIYADNINQVRCYECQPGYQLYNSTCIKCDSGQYFDVVLKNCIKCSVNNCYYCHANPNECQQCLPDYYFNGTACQLISVFLSSNENLTQSNSYEILSKLLLNSNNTFYNNQKLLITSCADESNGYSCICPATKAVYTSLCYSISTELQNLKLYSNQLFGSPTTSLSKSIFFKNIQILKLLSELPNYSFTYQSITSDLLSLPQMSSYLQIQTNQIRFNQSEALSIFEQVCDLVFNQFSQAYNPFDPTVIIGAGYYFKYSPANPRTDISDFVSTIQNGPRIAEVILILFNSTIDSSRKRLTGTIYISLNEAKSQSIGLKVKKIGFLSNFENYLVMQNDLPISLSTSSDSDGFITISNVSTSTTSATTPIIKGYYVSTSLVATADIYSYQRIQNIFYRDSFIYILVFLLLYLIFLPMCALVDFVDEKSKKRKIQKSEQGTYHGVNNAADIEEEIIIHINYRDFFPIYNVANSSRPRRLLKLCLFIVNCQHGITFLTIIYFNLNANQQIVAVLLSIPAYLCTIIMGYVCGLLSLKLPGKTKYLINLFTIGYWIIWVVLMSRFKSEQYKPFIYVFAIIFFFVDLVIDLLQTLLVYFTIKQQQKQIRLFKVLSRWLSYRGYYQFDKMAKEINEARQSA